LDGESTRGVERSLPMKLNWAAVFRTGTFHASAAAAQAQLGALIKAWMDTGAACPAP
jgi:hypothetical protein